MTGMINLQTGSTPGAPASGYARAYFDSSGNLHIVKSDGTDTQLSAQTLAALTDVSISSPATDQVLKYSGSAWVNAAVPAGGTVTDIPQNIAFSGDISPSSIGIDQDNYNPTGLSTASTLRLTSSTAVNITGLAGGADGQLILIHNIGSNNITLKDESASSTAANRFALAGDATLAADTSCLLRYDATSNRWRLVDLAAATAHIAASAAVHGLPASVNVLGNRAAAGEFVQRAATSGVSSASAATLSNYGTASVTFAVSFSSAPIVVVCGSTGGYPAGADSITTTGFVVTRWSNASNSYLTNWIALGA